MSSWSYCNAHVTHHDHIPIYPYLLDIWIFWTFAYIPSHTSHVEPVSFNATTPFVRIYYWIFGLWSEAKRNQKKTALIDQHAAPMVKVCKMAIHTGVLFRKVIWRHFLGALKGCPSILDWKLMPSNWFRWCTDLIFIHPTCSAFWSLPAWLSKWGVIRNEKQFPCLPACPPL